MRTKIRLVKDVRPKIGMRKCICTGIRLLARARVGASPDAARTSYRTSWFHNSVAARGGHKAREDHQILTCSIPCRSGAQSARRGREVDRVLRQMRWHASEYAAHMPCKSCVLDWTAFCRAPHASRSASQPASTRERSSANRPRCGYTGRTWSEMRCRPNTTSFHSTAHSATQKSTIIRRMTPRS